MSERGTIYNFSKLINRSDDTIAFLDSGLNNLDKLQLDYFQKIKDKKFRYASILRFAKIHNESIYMRIVRGNFTNSDLINLINGLLKPANDTKKNKLLKSLRALKELSSDDVKFGVKSQKKDEQRVVFDRIVFNIDRLKKLNQDRYKTSKKTLEATMFCMIDISLCLEKIYPIYHNKYPRIPWRLIQLKETFNYSEENAFQLLEDFFIKKEFDYLFTEAYQEEFDTYPFTSEGKNPIKSYKSIRTVTKK